MFFWPPRVERVLPGWISKFTEEQERCVKIQGNVKYILVASNTVGKSK